MSGGAGAATSAEADERIRRFEADNDLLRLQVDGWCVWPLFRFQVAAAIMQFAPTASPVRLRLGRGERVLAALRDLRRLRSLRKARHCVLVYASDRTERVGERFKDIFFDDLLTHLGDYLKIEEIDNRGFLPASRSALIGSDLSTIGIEVLAALSSRAAGPRGLERTAGELCGCIRRDLGLPGFSPSPVARRLRNFVWVKRIARRLLRRIGPRHLLLVCAYGSPAIVAAARELGVRVTEFQHGFVGRHHWGYSWSRYAVPYRAAMPVPDRIFLYGEHWKSELEASGFWREELRAVGSLRMDEYRARRAPPGSTCRIAVTTQPIDSARFLRFMEEFLAIAPGRLDFELVLKLHPGEASAQPYAPLLRGRPNVRAVLSWEPPSTFALLAQSDIHVSISSTCHFEAIGLGLRTVILPLQTHEDILHLAETGCATAVRTPQELLEAILRNRSRPVPGEVGARFFTPGALENMKRELGT